MHEPKGTFETKLCNQAHALIRASIAADEPIYQPASQPVSQPGQATQLSQWHWHQQQVSKASCQDMNVLSYLLCRCCLAMLSATIYNASWCWGWCGTSAVNPKFITLKAFLFSVYAQTLWLLQLVWHNVVCVVRVVLDFCLAAHIRHFNLATEEPSKCVNYTSYTTRKFQLKPRQSSSTTAAKQGIVFCTKQQINSSKGSAVEIHWKTKYIREHSRRLSANINLLLVLLNMFSFLSLKTVGWCNHIVHWAFTKPISVRFYISDGWQTERMAIGVEQGVNPYRKGLPKRTDKSKER